MLSLNCYRILVVDDVADNLFLTQTVLEAEGYQVETASSGTAALEMLRRSDYDLVLLDVMMPDMNGLEVTERIRQSRLSDLPILLLTAHDRATLNRGLSLGANGFVRKPVDFDQLMRTIEQILLQPQKASEPNQVASRSALSC